MRRVFFCVLLCSTVFFGAYQSAGAAAATAYWDAAPPLATARSSPAAFVRPDGRIVLYGGAGEGPDSEFYDPAAGSSGAAGGRGSSGSEPALLADGRLLVTGGGIAGNISPSDFRTTAEVAIYDPATGQYTPAESLAHDRYRHTATTLRDGSVLVVGGFSGGGIGPGMGAGAVAEAERFDPRTGRWSPAGRLAMPRGDHTATPLPDGRVLVAGGYASGAGYFAAAEVYDPATNGWTTTGALITARRGQRAVALDDGSVLVIGGTGYEYVDGGYALATAERYDPATGRWSPAGQMLRRREAFAAARLTDGRVLVAGDGRASATTEIFDPATGAWTDGPPLAEGRRGGTIVALPGGRAVIVGGYGAADVALRRAEVFVADGAPGRCFAETGECVRGRFLAYWEEHGGLAINGYPIGPERSERLEDGAEHIVQYFERARFEYHPANAAPYDVQLGQFGRRILAARLGGTPPVVAPLAGARFFPETGHNAGGDFRDYWEVNGGLAQFGYPLTEEFDETLEDGNRYTVQYFERARFERHQAPGGTVVLLGQFGRAIMGENAQAGAAGR